MSTLIVLICGVKILRIILHERGTSLYSPTDRPVSSKKKSNHLSTPSIPISELE